MSRKQEYDEVGMGVNWKLRGVGFLYTMKDVVLAAEVSPGGNAVYVYNVMPRSNATTSPRDDCDKLSLWVRVYGPDVFAGSPVAVPATETTDCYWKFDFEVTPSEECRPVHCFWASSFSNDCLVHRLPTTSANT
jgi:hypothetical protein